MGKGLERAKIPPVIPELGPLEAAGLASGKDALSMFPELAGKYLPPAPPPGTLNMGIAYHGSPHKFEKFDASKIGTGEGAQAYGHGLYFAENPNVAEQYKKAGLQTLPDEAKYGNKKIQTWYDEAQKKQDLSYRTKNKDLIDRANAEVNYWESLLTGKHPNQVKFEVNEPDYGWQAMTDFANKIDNTKFKNLNFPEASLYTVNIPDEHIDRMLDWDKPFAKQQKYVKDTLRDSGVYQQYKSNQSDFSSPQATRGINMRGENIHAFIEHTQGSPEKASQFLSDIGIPGIKYLDQGSRGTGEGTRNIVVFPGNENIIEPISRNDELLNP